MVKIWGFRELIWILLNTEAKSPPKPTKVGFIFIGPKSIQVEQKIWQMSIKWQSLKPILNQSLRNDDTSQIFLIMGSELSLGH